MFTIVNIFHMIYVQLKYDCSTIDMPGCDMITALTYDTYTMYGRLQSLQTKFNPTSSGEGGSACSQCRPSSTSKWIEPGLQ